MQLDKSCLCIFSGMLQQQGIFKVLNKTYVRRVKTLKHCYFFSCCSQNSFQVYYRRALSVEFTVAFTCTMYTFYNLMLHDVCDRRQCLSFQSCASCSVLSAEIRMFHAYLMIDITFVHVNGSPPIP